VTSDLPDVAFTEPWQPRAFAMAKVACERMELPWDAFRDQLKAAIAEDPDRPYYESWLLALERLTTVTA
jgi:Nitrile hydratase beta subunit